jgi:hypothetical protein
MSAFKLSKGSQVQELKSVQVQVQKSACALALERDHNKKRRAKRRKEARGREVKQIMQKVEIW